VTAERWVLVSGVITTAAGLMWGHGMTIVGMVMLISAGVNPTLRVIVVLWSLRANRAGRRHALAILRLLRSSPRKPPRS
jgi:hypothetical protein